jgi:hypothetical protein
MYLENFLICRIQNCKLHSTDNIAGQTSQKCGATTYCNLLITSLDKNQPEMLHISQASENRQSKGKSDKPRECYQH